MTYTIPEIKSVVVPIAKNFGIKKVSLFGSYARGEQTENSDIDFLIDKGNLYGFAFFGLIEELENSLQRNIDVLTYSALERSLIKNAIQDEVVIYEE